MIVIGMMVGIVLTYPIFMRIVAQKMQPKRLEMARLGNLLLKREDLEDDHRHIIKMMLADAFDAKPVIMLVCVFPVFAFKGFRKHTSTPSTSIPLNIATDMKRFKTLHLVSLFAANPLFSIILLIEIMIIAAIFTPIAILAGNSDDINLTQMANSALIRSELALRHREFA